MDRDLNWGGQAFLALLPAAAGCLLGSVVIDPAYGTRAFVIACVTIALVFALVGAVAPVLRIKKPSRSYRFLAGILRSPLSRQAFFVGLFVIVLIVHWALVLAGTYALWLGVVTVVAGAAAVLASGLAYRLRGQPAWRHWSTPVSLFGGLLGLGASTSLVIALGWRDVLLAGTSAGLAMRILVLAGAAGLAGAIWGRAAYLDKGGPRTKETRTLTQHEYRWTHFVGALLVIVAGGAAAVSFASDWLMIVVFAALLVGLFVHWRLFFVTATPLSWKAEVQWFAPVHTAGKE
jgi:DMSO reductase anchor subunit